MVPIQKYTSLFSGIYVSRYNSIAHVNPQVIELFSSVIRYQSRHILPYSYKIQLNQDIKYHMNTMANINPDMALSVFSVICLTRYNSIRNSRFTGIP